MSIKRAVFSFQRTLKELEAYERSAWSICVPEVTCSLSRDAWGRPESIFLWNFETIAIHICVHAQIFAVKKQEVITKNDVLLYNS